MTWLLSRSVTVLFTMNWVYSTCGYLHSLFIKPRSQGYANAQRSPALEVRATVRGEMKSILLIVHSPQCFVKPGHERMVGVLRKRWDVIGLCRGRIGGIGSGEALRSCHCELLEQLN